ncbi:MAG: DUF3450 family protein, partial [Candidatus Muiribacteriaceae bacterium]
EGADAEVERLRTLNSELIRVREEISTERREWKNEKNMLEKENDLLLREKDYLNDEIEKMKKQNVTASDKYRSLIRERDINMRSLKQARPSVERGRQRVKEIFSLLPESMKKELQQLYSRVVNSDHSSVTSSLQAVLSLYSAIEKRQNSWQLYREILGESENECEYKVLYSGLCIGFAVSTDGSRSGVKILSDGEWVFKRDDSIAEKVNNAVDIFEKKKAPVITELPFSLKGVR